MIHAATYGIQCNIGAFYASLYNALDFPAGCVPVTLVTEADERRCGAEYPLVDFWARAIQKEFAADTVGLPVGVQVVALPNRDETALRLMAIIEAHVKKEA